MAGLKIVCHLWFMACVILNCQALQPDTLNLNTDETLNGFRYINNKKLSDDVIVNVTFDVMSCTEAKVALTSGCASPKPRYVFKFGISDRGGFLLYYCESDCSVIVSNFSQYNLSCTDFKTFWVSWYNDVISAGIGTKINQNVVISKGRQNLFTVDYIIIRSVGTATWKWKTSLVADSKNFHLMKTCQLIIDETTLPETTLPDPSLRTITVSNHGNEVVTTSKITTGTKPASTEEVQTSISVQEKTSAELSTISGLISTTITPSRQETTAFIVNQLTTLKGKCVCPCSDAHNVWSSLRNQNMSHSELLEYLHDHLVELKANISINAKKTSAYNSTKISAGDDRSSSAVFGLFGVVLMALPLLLAIIIDLSRFVQHVKPQ